MIYSSNKNPMFRSQWSEDIFNQKYSRDGCETWAELAQIVVADVCENRMTNDEKDTLVQHITNLKFLPGGRYLYYAGRPRKFFNNCYLLRAEEDTREDWAELSKKTELCLMTGGGIGVDYTNYRPSNSSLTSTGGIASGPIPKMQMINEIGRNVIQGGARRSAIYGSLNWQHDDVDAFLKIKNWHHMKIAGTKSTYWDVRNQDFNFPCPLDMTNISINYDNTWLMDYWKTGDLSETFLANCQQALQTGEPGFSFNFFDREKETLRNACTEVTSEDDSDVCNLGSLNLGRIDSIEELAEITELATKFLLCGTLKADLPYEKIHEVRTKNRRLGLGLMGLHEWLIKKGYKYEIVPELHQWLSVYRGVSDNSSANFSGLLGVSRPVANRAIAPTGTIGILAGTSTGIEPIFAAAYKRRFLKDGKNWRYQYVVEQIAREFSDLYGADPDDIDCALSLASNPEQRIKLQAEVQAYVDMAISSTINLPAFNTKHNNPDKVKDFAEVLAKYAHRLRGFTCFPDGSRGGQPLTPVPYKDAVDKLGKDFEEHVEAADICSITGHGGTCGG